MIAARKESIDAHLEMFTSIQEYNYSSHEANQKERIAVEAMRHADRCWQVSGYDRGLGLKTPPHALTAPHVVDDGSCMNWWLKHIRSPLECAVRSATISYVW